MKKTCHNSVVWSRMFPLPGWFGFTTSRAAFAKLMKQMGVQADFAGDGVAARCTSFEPLQDKECEWHFIVTYDREAHEAAGNKPCQEAAVLAHEACHAYEQMLRSIGAQDPGGELRAYCTQRILQDMLQELADADAKGVAEL